jgi:GntR family transcriptional regulator / MocR family aminotransferase
VTHEISGGNSGLHLTIRLPTHYPDQIIAEKARSVGMNPRALSSFSLIHQTADNGLVIGYGNTAPESFIPLIKKLAQIANQTRIP